MKNITIIFIYTFLCQVGFSQINSLKIEAFTRGFTKEVELLDIGIKYKLKESWKPETTLIDTIILITLLQKDTLQFLGKNIDFSGLKTWKGSTKNSSVDGDYYSYLTINGIKSSYYDFRTGFKEIEPFYRYFLKMLNEKALYHKK